MTKSFFLPAALTALAFASQAQATLTASANGAMVYDSVDNVTWMSTNNYMQQEYLANNTYYNNGLVGQTVNSPSLGAGYTVTSADFEYLSSINRALATYEGTEAWVNSLNTSAYLGQTSWIMPSLTDFQNMFSQLTTEFGPSTDPSNTSSTGYYNQNVGPFGYLMPTGWDSQTGTCTTGAPCIANPGANGGGYVNLFIAFPAVSHGIEVTGSTAAQFSSAWAIVPGNAISAVPVPGAVWLFGSGMAGLAGFNRRKLIED